MIERLSAALADRYRIERELGAGGMATVYLAHDIKHDRKVALKVLKPELAAVLGAERFLAEIKTTANLQHPHILPLHDSGEVDGTVFYVMPFVEGESLRERLIREKQLPIAEAVRIASEIASALDYAHRRGVIHRDIKPENLLLHDGQALVADFGIALAASRTDGGVRMTETGMSLGTPHYMSPEQAMGERSLDARTDIYALGCVLYEMLAGEPPHNGPTAQAIVAKVLTDEPRPLSQLRKTVPSNVAAAVTQALAKLPADRFESAKQFAGALANPMFVPVAASAPYLTAATSQPWRRWLRDPRSWAVLLIAVVLGSIALTVRNKASDAVTSTLRFTVQGPADSSVLAVGTLGVPSAPVVSSDGRRVAFHAHTAAGHVLYVRNLALFELSRIADNALGGFFSPDNTSIGFFRGAEVWTADLDEPVAARIGAIPEIWWDMRAAVWHPDGRILIAAARGLWALPVKGGEPILLAAIDSSGRERLDDVGVLPDGRILLAVTTGQESRTEVLSPDGTKRVRILPGFERVQVVDDIMFYLQGGQARATYFDARHLQPIGSPAVLPELQSGNRIVRAGRSIAWVDGPGVNDLEPVWVTTTGTVSPLDLQASRYRWPRISPDLSRIAIAIGFGARLTSLHTIAVRSGAKASIEGDSEPVWSSDGRFVFTSRGNRPLGGLIRHIADGSRAPDTLLVLDRGDAWPTDLSPDGRWLAYYGATVGAGAGADATDPTDLMFLDLTTRQSRRLRINGAQRGAHFSPDGRWLAYQSTEAGAEEVFVRPWPALDAKYQVSSGGGGEPLWAPNGKTLYYRHRNEMIEVPISVRDGGIERAAPRVLFAGNFYTDQSGDLSWDIGSDGRFLMLRPVSGARIDLQVVLNWTAEVRARLERAR